MGNPQKNRAMQLGPNLYHQFALAPKEARVMAANTMPEITPYGIRDSRSLVYDHACNVDMWLSAT